MPTICFQRYHVRVQFHGVLGGRCRGSVFRVNLLTLPTSSSNLSNVSKQSRGRTGGVIFSSMVAYSGTGLFNFPFLVWLVSRYRCAGVCEFPVVCCMKWTFWGFCLIHVNLFLCKVLFTTSEGGCLQTERNSTNPFSDFHCRDMRWSSVDRCCCLAPITTQYIKLFSNSWFLSLKRNKLFYLSHHNKYTQKHHNKYTEIHHNKHTDSASVYFSLLWNQDSQETLFKKHHIYLQPDARGFGFIFYVLSHSAICQLFSSNR